MKNSVLAPRNVSEMAPRIGTAEAHPAVWNQILRRSLRWLRNTIALAVVALPLILGGCAAPTTTPTTLATTPDTNPNSVPLSTLEKQFNSLDMSKLVAEDMWLMTDRPDANTIYLSIVNGASHKHLQQTAFDLISEIKQNKDFQQQVAAILADPNAVAQLKSSDIPSANSDGTVSMDIAHQGAWAELHKLTPEQIQQHNAATLKNLADSMNNPKAFDGDPSNAFKDKNGNVYADGTLLATAEDSDLQTPITYEVTNTHAPEFVVIKNARNIGTILDNKGNPEYWIVKVGTNKYLALNFADLPIVITMGAELTHTGSGTGGNTTGNPYYIPYEVARMFGNTDDTNVNGIALDILFDTSTPPQGNAPADVYAKFKEQVAQDIKFINALQGYGTDPNLLTAAQVQSLANGTSTLAPTKLAPGIIQIPDADDYLLNI